MKQEIKSGSFESVLKRARAKASLFEIWPKYYDYRYLEITSILRELGINRIGKALDIGCGNSFSSSLLSVIANRVIAIDLPETNQFSHSVGLATANNLQKRVGTEVPMIGGIGENLPFKYNEFDFLFSMYVLEHVTDKRRVVEEMFRVLKPSGIAVLVVPYAAERIYALPHYYLHAIKWLFKRLTAKPVKTTFAQHIEKYKKFLMPPPHGNYKSSFEEFKAHRKKEWLRLIEPLFKVESSFAGMIYPIDFANELLGFCLGFFIFTRVHKISKVLERIVGRNLLMPFGNSLCIVARKRTSA